MITKLWFAVNLLFLWILTLHTIILHLVQIFLFFISSIFFFALYCFFLFCFIFFTDIKWPASLKDVEKVEKQNNLAINVFGYENGSIYPLHLTKSSSSPINLLLISEEEDGQTNTHYCWIKDFDRLCYDQTKHCNKETLLSAVLFFVQLKRVPRSACGWLFECHVREASKSWNAGRRRNTIILQPSQDVEGKYELNANSFPPWVLSINVHQYNV